VDADRQDAKRENEDGSDGASHDEDQSGTPTERGDNAPLDEDPSSGLGKRGRGRTSSPLRLRKRESDEDAARIIEEERKELIAQLQADYGEIRWTGPVRLGRRAGVLLTFDCGLAAIYTEDDREHAGFLPAEDIAWLNPRVRSRSVEIVLSQPADIAPGGSLIVHGQDDQLFQVLATIPRPAPPRSIERSQPTIARRPTPRREPAVADDHDGLSCDRAWPVEGRQPFSGDEAEDRLGPSDSRRAIDSLGAAPSTRRSEPLTRRDRRGVEQHSEGEDSIAARVTTAFSPTAYVELPDGVLRPCAWGGTGEPPAVNASVQLRPEAPGWVAMSIREGAVRS
jgi:hypothetical protein